MALPTIGFIGLGNMGWPMAERLIGHGYRLTVCDARAGTLEPFTAKGAVTATVPADTATCDLVIVMVANDAQVESVTVGPDGIAAGIDPLRPPLVVIMSSVLPATVTSVATVLAQKGARTVDAAVSGGGVRAGEGTLSVMVGGPEANVAELKPVLDTLASKVFYCGPLGRGVAVKIINNLVGITALFAMREASEVAMRLGIDLAFLAQVMEASSGRNTATLDHGAQRAFYRYNTKDLATLSALVDICNKDLGLARKLARAMEVPTPILEAAADALAQVPYEEILRSWQLLAEL